MNDTPRPTKCSQEDQARRWFCRYYSGCLDKAVASQWSGWNCLSCKAYELVEWDREALLEDALSCRALLLVLFCRENIKQARVSMLIRQAEQAHREGQWFQLD